MVVIFLIRVLFFSGCLLDPCWDTVLPCTSPLGLWKAIWSGALPLWNKGQKVGAAVLFTSLFSFLNISLYAHRPVSEALIETSNNYARKRWQTRGQEIKVTWLWLSIDSADVALYVYRTHDKMVWLVTSREHTQVKAVCPQAWHMIKRVHQHHWTQVGSGKFYARERKLKCSQSLESEQSLCGQTSQTVLELDVCEWLGETWTTERAWGKLPGGGTGGQKAEPA